mgnify:CR=1 FL=1
MAEPSRRPATYEDLKAVPPHLVAEIIFGSLETHPRPAPRHAAASNSLSHELTGPFQKGRGGPGGWIFLVEPELHLGPNVVVPDLAAWRRERMPEMPHAPFFTLAPDWVTEVLSPSTAALDRADKAPIYANERASHLWLVDPLARTLEILRLDGATYRVVAVHKDDAKVRAEPFDAIELDLAILWAR